MIPFFVHFIYKKKKTSNISISAQPNTKDKIPVIPHNLTQRIKDSLNLKQIIKTEFSIFHQTTVLVTQKNVNPGLSMEHRDRFIHVLGLNVL